MSRRSITSFIAMLGLVAATVVSADIPQTTGARPDRLEGVWDSVVTLRDCGTQSELQSFRALNVFERDGALVATSTVAPTPSVGRWERLGPARYRASGRFLRYGAGGVFEGMQQVSRTIQMDASGDSFTSVVEIEVFDVFDVVIGQRCATETARRIY